MRLLLSLVLALVLAAPAAAQVAIPSAAGRDVVQKGLATGLKIILPGTGAGMPLLDLVKNAPQIGSDCAVSLRGGPRLGCYQGGKFVAQPDGLAVGAVPTHQAARQPDAAVSLGGVSGFTGLADPAASARFRASGRGTGYVHFSATDTAFQPALPAIASTFAPTGPGVLEVSYSNTGSGGGFTPDFWGRSDYVARITSKGFAPTAAVVNLDYGTYAVPWSDLAGWKAYVDGARARTSVRVLAPVIAPNQSGGPGAAGDAATVAVVKPWSDPFWASVKQAMLYGGGVSIDAPPIFFFSGLPTKVQQDAYQAFVRDVIAWGYANNLWVAVLVSPYFDKAAFPRNARRYYDALRSADRLPSHWVVLNYDQCGSPYPRACAPSDPTYQATIGTEGTPSSQAAVALWYARHAKVRAYAGTYAGALARPVGQVAPVRINDRDGADQRVQAADVEGVDTMAGQPAEAPVMGAATMDSATVNGPVAAAALASAICGSRGRMRSGRISTARPRRSRCSRAASASGRSTASATPATPATPLPRRGPTPPWAPRDSDVAVIARRGGLALTGMSRTSDGAGLQYGIASIGVAGFMHADSPNGAGWGLYSDVVASAPGAGALGLEIAAKNASGTDIDSQPYFVAKRLGVRGIWLAGGGDNSYGPRGTNHLDAAITVFRNGLGGGYTWRNGLVFAPDGLVGTDGSATSTGVATAVKMGRRQRLEWWTPEQPETGGAPAVTLTSSVTAYGFGTHLDVNDAGVDLVSPDGATTLRLSREGGGVKMSAVGAAADIGAQVTAKGAGLALIGNEHGYTYVDGGGVLRVSGALAVTGGAGFNGTPPVGKCTLAAALPTDGSASNAALASAFNSARACLVSIGLAQ